MNNLLVMRVDTVMPQVNLSEVDASIEALSNAAKALPDGGAKDELQATVDRLFEQRDAVRRNAEFDMVHVTFVDADNGDRPIGAANFMLPSGKYKEGATYRITLEEVTS